jgi:endonuclease/exonuclease/phosphatase family metal-dependent hydrolase
VDLVKALQNNLRVLTYNIHKGVCFYSRKQVLSNIRSLIREVGADLVFLQEIRGKGSLGLHDLENSAEFDSQLEFLADSVWEHYAYGKNAVYQEGSHGNAILSCFPVRQWTNLDISTNPLEKRGLLHVSVSHPNLGDLNLVCLHLNLFAGSRRQQLDRLIQRISEAVSEGPLLVAGDFNDWSQGASRHIRERIRVREAFHTLYGRYARTFPSPHPLLCLDRIYYRGLTPIEAMVMTGSPWNRLSDHAALVVDFKLQ